MTNKDERLEGQLPLPMGDGEKSSTALLKWEQETGAALIALAEMLKKPTDVRPFVYDVRFELMSLQASVGKVVLKGFGADGGLVAFHDATGLVDGVRGLTGRLKSGKINWYEDQYAGKNYEAKQTLYLSGKVYRL